MTTAPIVERPLLAVDALSVSYGEAKAVTDVSFRLESGRAVAVLGANGAGKSSLAAALVGVVRPTGGRVWFDGVDITRSAGTSRQPGRYRLRARGPRDLPAPHGRRQPAGHAPVRGSAARPRSTRSTARSSCSRCSVSGAGRRRDAVGWRAADALARAGARRTPQAARGRRDVTGPRADDGRRRLRQPDPGQGRGRDGVARGAVRRTGARARRRRDRAPPGRGRVGGCSRRRAHRNRRELSRRRAARSSGTVKMSTAGPTGP